MRVALLFCLLPGILAVTSHAVRAETRSPLEGLWRTVDDHSGAPRALVRIYRQGEAYFGRVEASLVPGEEGERCSACTDERKDQPVVGMTILRNMKADEDGFGGGDVLDPESGSVYSCALRLEDEGRRLVVRGYIGLSLFGRSQSWYRTE